MNERMNRNRLNVGVYHLRPYARTEAHVRDLKDCGVDFVICMDYDRPALDLFQKYGVGAIVSGVLPAWWGGDGNNAGKFAETNPIEIYREAAKTFVDHPAVWGVDVGDEPSALDFPHYGLVTDEVNRLFPHQFAYLNLYPNYASVAQNNADETVNQLGTATYGEHIDAYCREVGLDYLCYDFYLYSLDEVLAYENLITVSDACRRTGRSMWIVLQVNSQKPEVWITENELRFQAFSAMAFGTENITWGCYTAGWWHNQVLDDKGEKTEQYEKLKTVNAEIRAIADDYMRFKRNGTFFVGFEKEKLPANAEGLSAESLSNGVFFDLKADGMPLVVGEMTSRTEDGRTALMICAADDPFDKAPKTATLTFTSRRSVRAVGGKGEIALTKNGNTYSLTLSSNQGVLLIAEKVGE